MYIVDAFSGWVGHYSPLVYKYAHVGKQGQRYIASVYTYKIALVLFFSSGCLDMCMLQARVPKGDESTKAGPEGKCEGPGDDTKTWFGGGRKTKATGDGGNKDDKDKNKEERKSSEKGKRAKKKKKTAVDEEEEEEHEKGVEVEGKKWQQVLLIFSRSCFTSELA